MQNGLRRSRVPISEDMGSPVIAHVLQWLLQFFPWNDAQVHQHVSQVDNLHPALKKAARDRVHDSGGSLFKFPTDSNLSAVKAPLHMGLSRSFSYTLFVNLHDTSDQVEFSQVE